MTARSDETLRQEAWAYLEAKPAEDAPVSDNPSGLYCAACRAAGLAHCSWPEYCGGMRRMKPAAVRSRPGGEGE